MTLDFKPYTEKELLEVAQEVITGQVGKDPNREERTNYDLGA